MLEEVVWSLSEPPEQARMDSWQAASFTAADPEALSFWYAY